MTDVPITEKVTGAFHFARETRFLKENGFLAGLLKQLLKSDGRVSFRV